MYIENGIVFAGEKRALLKVTGARPMEEYKLQVRFSTGEVKIYDMKPLLTTAAFSPLSDKSVFESVCIDCGVPVWNDGDIDIAPEELYQNGVTA